MSFDIAAFEARIIAMTDEIYRLRKTWKVTSRNKEIGYLSIDPREEDGKWFSLQGTTGIDDLSRHGELSEAAAQACLFALGAEILESLLEAAPVMRGQPVETVTFRFGPRTKRGPQVSMSLFDITLGPRGLLHDAPDLGRRLQVMTARVAALPQGDRVFRFNDCHDLRAASPQDAYRLYAAIAKPGLFDAELAAGGRPVEMAELFDPAPFQDALLQEAPA